MPTMRPRHQVTETPEVAHALDVAAMRWPNEPRSKLLLRLVHAGCAALDDQRSVAIHAREQAIDETNGKYADIFGEDYLGELRRDWPQ